MSEMFSKSYGNVTGGVAGGVDVTRNASDAELLGKYAAHLFAIEQTITQFSPFKRVTRWFCDSELSFAACCCYTSQTCPDMYSSCRCRSNCILQSNNKNNNTNRNAVSKNTNVSNSDSNNCNSTTCTCHTYCSIYGPVPDPTRERTAFGNIIINATASHFLCGSL